MDQDATWYGDRPWLCLIVFDGLYLIVFDVEPATLRKKGTPTPPKFWPMFIVGKWLDG